MEGKWDVSLFDESGTREKCRKFVVCMECKSILKNILKICFKHNAHAEFFDEK